MRITFGQVGRSRQPFGEGKNAHRNLCQVHICYFCDKCDVFAGNCKFANLIQYNMQYIPCNNALIAQETLLLFQKSTFFPKDSQKMHDLRQILISRQNNAQNFRPSPNFSGKAPCTFAQLLPPYIWMMSSALSKKLPNTHL